jgi:hypothetical protein
VKYGRPDHGEISYAGFVAALMKVAVVSKGNFGFESGASLKQKGKIHLETESGV